MRTVRARVSVLGNFFLALSLILSLRLGGGSVLRKGTGEGGTGAHKGEAALREGTPGWKAGRGKGMKLGS